MKTYEFTMRVVVECNDVLEDEVWQLRSEVELKLLNNQRVVELDVGPLYEVALR